MLKRWIFICAAVFFIFPTGYTHLSDEQISSETSFNDTYFETYINWFYDNLDINSFDKPERKVFKKALTGFFKLKEESQTKKNLLVVIDFSLSSKHERMWVIDLDKMKITDQMLVSHGQNSGELFATRFSNIPSSYQSSLGFYVTGDIYYGRHGMSLFLNGMEPGINDKARERAIVMHSADYVSHDFVRRHGRLGRSHGCPAIPMENHEDVIRLLARGTCLFIYHPTASYTKKSALLTSENAMAGMIKFLEESPLFTRDYTMWPLLAQLLQ
ncbi:murein L,D-transpeptidase catalytic domain family protein [Natronoflexus pectinivorans]|uniref:L,D-transpeptidase-like protein n=1 Tax=Natronoflexus pectinivorans TaxID=682526 RepID=A0A4R2GDY1_9BACT|nr:murein L,D-transpeptidase catalytic domain family protein [Natronoflexus pectinivorans]TCO06120.1 L,D-transpeptidase-like protein [Natronoflexus pectinivorans]